MVLGPRAGMVLGPWLDLGCRVYASLLTPISFSVVPRAPLDPPLSYLSPLPLSLLYSTVLYCTRYEGSFEMDQPRMGVYSWLDPLEAPTGSPAGMSRHCYRHG